MAKRKQDDPRFYVWHSQPGVPVYYAQRIGDEIKWTQTIQDATRFTFNESYEMQQQASSSWKCSFIHYEDINSDRHDRPTD